MALMNCGLPNRYIPVLNSCAVYLQGKNAAGTKEENDIPKGIVKWYVEMLDETSEHVGIATILTMVKRKTSTASKTNFFKFSYYLLSSAT